MSRKVYFIALLFLAIIAGVPVHAMLQGQAKVDSLLRELPRQKEDTNKVKLLGNLSNELEPLNADDAVGYGKQGLVLAKKLGWKSGIALLEQALGLGYKAKADFPAALSHLQESARLSGELGNKRGLGRSFGNMGTIYRAIGDATKALEYFTKAVSVFTELRDTMGIATFSGNIGNVYCDELRNYDKALEYMFAALKLFEAIEEPKGIARNTSNIGNVYGYKGNYTTAFIFFWRSLKIAEQIGDKQRIMDNLNGIANVYFQLALGNAAGDRDVSLPVDLLSELPKAKYVPEKGIPKGKDALLRSSVEYHKKALAIAKEIKDIYVEMGCYQQLAQTYRVARDFENAYGAEVAANELKDSIFSQENRDQIMKLDLQYEYDRQRLTDSLRAAKKEQAIVAHLQRQRAYTYAGIAGVLALLVFSFFIMKERRRSELERKKSDELLLNILPAEVAQELKVKGRTTATHHENVTVLFTDFVNFTSAAERMNPQALIDELHMCFKAFDEITRRYEIEKIKTIGDAYLAVCGLPQRDPQHAEKVVRAAIDMNDFMAARLAKLGSERTFAIRIGIHSGSVVAGIVGVKKFAYDIWGDTVNTAARMEQHGETGRINISQTTYELVKDKFNCEYRGEVEAKGKGVMKMYFVA